MMMRFLRLLHNPEVVLRAHFEMLPPEVESPGIGPLTLRELKKIAKKQTCCYLLRCDLDKSLMKKAESVDEVKRPVAVLVVGVDE